MATKLVSIVAHAVQLQASKVCSSKECGKDLDPKADVVIQLKRAIYGLKQSLGDWYDTIVAWLTQPEAEGGQGFRQSAHDLCLISKLRKTHPELFVGKQKKEKKKGKPTLIPKVLMARRSG